MLSFYSFSLFFQFISKDIQQQGFEHCWPPSIRKMSHAFPILNFFFFCFNQCTDPSYIISVRAFQTLSDAIRKSKPTVSSRSLLPMCLGAPSKSSSRLGKRLGSSPKNSNLSMCQVLLLGQMLGLGDQRALDPIKKPLPSWRSHRNAGGGPSGLLVDLGPLLTLQWGSPGASLGRKMCWEGLPTLSPGVKSALSFCHMALFSSVGSFQRVSVGSL